ncbi:hypothetical protein BT96DRAFT_1005472 [Gymnopus androsaceus JB14]|uniref:CxC1-like cysteine cluster associated with KDZ transposases domain-containing protein n=1 Tax=Gymnopus androsaceus JB14 TaxID=1447944 RepID=A0A6A4GPC5_9AGAR|nr:hypothetical protein BT96DRAFT_1005472 [Gymnopus androsaceus JB14]
MSRLRLPKKDLQKDPVGAQTPPRLAYNLFSSSPQSSSPTKRSARPIVYLPNGKTLSQCTHLPIPHGQVGFLEHPNDDRGMTTAVSSSGNIHNVFGDGSENFVVPTPHLRKRLAQSARWENEKIYLLEAQECVCLNKGLNLEVVVVRFTNLQKITLRTCSCQTAPTQLMKHGLFGCAPLRPSLAVDLRVLDFVTRLFLRISPNNTTVCNTIEDFLKSQGYQLRGQDPFPSAFCKRFIVAVVDDTEDDHLANNTPAGSGSQPLRPLSMMKMINDLVREVAEIAQGEARTRPSDYLRARCPICFGGKSRFAEGLSTIRTRTSQDCIPETPQKQRRGQGSQDEEDGFEGSLRVPNSVLDACGESFTAANGDRQKASTQFFDSTALMGLLCRHDRVLWLVNMTTPGERQHYALTLVDTLFDHLPDDWSVGLLYDIACQLERSCVKWGFLEQERLRRLSFAISVFHAFGHGWPCQCIYHPRKCKGFGLCDGEGCERFWHSISKLIAYLRVCGHHQRLYTLDSQIQHLDRESLWGLGLWLARKWKHARTRREEAQKDVSWSMCNPDFLREQWRLQVESQTKPLPRQSKASGKKAVEEALRLRKARDTLHDSVKRLENVITDISAEPYEVATAELELDPLREKLEKTQSVLTAKEHALGVQARTQYRHLASSPFIMHRMNARALKLRLRQKLRSRKFERDRLERSFRRQMNTSERKLQNHTEHSITRRDPGIQSLAKKYNELCSKMTGLIQSRRAPANAVAPKPIVIKELFSLDVDDSIWDDIGLSDDDDTAEPPLWLCDEHVRTGIRGILLRDRCDEEFLRLKHELLALKEWFMEEWLIVARAMEDTEDMNLLHQLRERRRDLARMYVVWDKALAALPREDPMESWGPTGAELLQAMQEVESDLVEEFEVEYEESEDSDFDEDDLDLGLIERIDALDLSDNVQEMEMDEEGL